MLREIPHIKKQAWCCTPGSVLLWCVVLAAALTIGGCGKGEPLIGRDELVAQAYGSDHWGSVERLSFTFNQASGTDTVSREWTWYPHRDSVVFEGTGPDDSLITRGYVRGLLPEGNADPELHTLEKWFVNDSYRLLFPLHLVWDEDKIKVAVNEDQPLPIGDTIATRLTVTYLEEEPYAPGNVYELFVDKRTNLIREWSFHRASPDPTAQAAKWEAHEKVGPLMIAMRRLYSENLRVWFTEVAVKETHETDVPPPGTP